MAAGDATAADCPGKYDVVINGKGYVLLDSVEPSLPFRTHRAIYDITPTFVERSNVTGAYGDEQQDFFLTQAQNDWSGGQGQSFFRGSNTDSVNRYYLGARADISTVGQLSLGPAESQTGTAVTNPKVASSSWGSKTPAAVSGTTNTYTWDDTPTKTDRGAHGLGVAPSCQCASPGAIYLSSEGGGTVGIRRLDGAAFTYTTFSATGVSGLAYMGNVLYGVRAAASFDLVNFSTAGVVASVFPWKDANGTAMLPGAFVKLVQAGTVLYVVFDSEVWKYDGSNTTKVWEFPNNFRATDGCFAEGALFVSGTLSGITGYLGQVRSLSGTTEAVVWTTAGTCKKICAWKNGVVFGDTDTGIVYYDLAAAAASSVGQFGSSLEGGIFTNKTTIFAMSTVNADVTYWNSSNSLTGATTATFQSSWFDFDSSLSKLFRDVTVVFDSGGAGSSLDLTVTTDTGATTTFTGIASGTTYNPNITGKAAYYKFTWHPGVAPSIAVKRVYMRAAPLLHQFASGTYILDCTQTVESPRVLRDGSMNPLTGYEQMQNLRATARATTPFTVTDKVNGTFTGLVDLQDAEGWDVYEVHPAPADVTRPGSYIVRIKVREV